MSKNRTLILGAGVTGISAGLASGLPVYEAQEVPGGICSSYYLPPGECRRLHSPPADSEVYRFEVGGGHWIFDGDPLVLRLVGGIAPLKSHVCRSFAYLGEQDLVVSYPILNHHRFYSPVLAATAPEEVVQKRGINRPSLGTAGEASTHSSRRLRLCLSNNL